MPTDNSALRIAKKAMQKPPLHCTRTEEVDKRGGCLETTSLMWYCPPRSKESSWIQVTSTDSRYYRAPSKRRRLESWHVTTLHIEYAESTSVTPTVVVYTSRHHFPSMVFDNYETRITGHSRSARWSQKSSRVTNEIQDLSWYARKRHGHNYVRALMSPREQVRRFDERPRQESS